MGPAVDEATRRVESCQPCPRSKGANCEQGLVVLEAGWWHPAMLEESVAFAADVSGETPFFKCHTTPACPVSNTTSATAGQYAGQYAECAVGHKGPLCAVCEAEYWPLAGKCMRCTDGAEAVDSAVGSGASDIVVGIFTNLGIFLAVGLVFGPLMYYNRKWASVRLRSASRGSRARGLRSLGLKGLKSLKTSAARLATHRSEVTSIQRRRQRRKNAGGVNKKKGDTSVGADSGAAESAGFVNALKAERDELKKLGRWRHKVKSAAQQGPFARRLAQLRLAIKDGRFPGQTLSTVIVFLQVMHYLYGSLDYCIEFPEFFKMMMKKVGSIASFDLLSDVPLPCLPVEDFKFDFFFKLTFIAITRAPRRP